jgi:hypothetical protein
MGEPFSGWIKLHRGLSRHALWLAEPFTIGQAWVDLLMLASYQPSTSKRGDLIVERGQVLTSLVSLGQRWRRDRKTVRRWLGTYTRDGMLTRRWATGRDGGFTLITIRNYDHYQSLPVVDGDSGRDSAQPDVRAGARDSAVDSGRDSGRDTFKKYQEAKDGELAPARAKKTGWEGFEPGEVKLAKYQPSETRP